ncbi:nucleotidyltransferase domain-containing protein [Saprospiraceae bacterium]|nr:nucleotidyltransferase domain-containing protein [Saprospiraceae bacterium]
MKTQIITYLKTLEREKVIRILYACETGSRAWGFPSRDSDYDVRLIYRHNLHWYLGLSDKKDSIDLMFADNEIDITGWDLKKSLLLLQKSNASIFERLASDTIYLEDKAFSIKMKMMLAEYFSPIKQSYHYLNLARNSNSFLHAEKYKLKKLFYALRSTCCALWIVENKTSPPMRIMEVLGGISIDQKYKNRIAELIKIKAEVTESYLHTGDWKLLQFIERSLSELEDKIKSLTTTKNDIKNLEAFFIETLKLLSWSA